MPTPKDDVYTISDDAEISIDDLFQKPGKRPGQTKGGKSRAVRGSRAKVEEPTLPTDKSPSLAATLSIFVCGSGQMYNGQTRMGLIFLLIEVLAVSSHLALYNFWGGVVGMAASVGLDQATLIISILVTDLLFLLFYVTNVIQAFKHAETWGRPFDGIGFAPLSALASAVVPGWGQLLNAQAGKATFFLTLTAILGYIAGVLAWFPLVRELVFADLDHYLILSPMTIAMAAGFSAGTIWLLGVYDAFLVGRYQR